MSEAILPTQAIDEEDHQTNNWSLARITYAVLMTIALLSHIWLMLIGAGIDTIPTYIWIIRLLPVPFAIGLGKLWKDRGFQILFLYFLLFFFRCFIPNSGSVFSVEVAESILSALWLFFACYGLARVLSMDCLKRLLFVCSIIWIFSITVFSCLGIYTVWTKESISLLADGAISLNMSGSIARLDIVYTSTTSGAILSITIFIDIITAIQVKKTIVKSLVLGALLPIFISLAFTDSRTAIISVSVGISMIVVTGIIHVFQRKKKLSGGKKEKWKSWIVAAILMIIVFALLVLIILQISPVFNQIKAGGIISRALAEGTERITVASRGFDGIRVLSGRKELWGNAIEYINQNRHVMLLGESKQNPLAGFNERFGHCHNIYLQILLESGIPGLLLFIWYMINTIKNSVKNLRESGFQAWISLLPVIPISLWVADLAECYIWLRSSFCPMITLFFVSTGLINAQATKHNLHQ